MKAALEILGPLAVIAIALGVGYYIGQQVEQKDRIIAYEAGASQVRDSLREAQQDAKMVAGLYAQAAKNGDIVTIVRSGGHIVGAGIRPSNMPCPLHPTHKLRMPPSGPAVARPINCTCY